MLEIFKTFFKTICSANVLTPFFSTIAATVTVLLVQFIARYIKEKRQKLYAINYIIYTYCKIIHSLLILKTLTIQPHIDAVKRMIEGDQELISKTFLADEFDILIDSSGSFNLLPEEYKILIAQDSLDFVQMYEIVYQMYKDETAKNNLNKFVKENLKIDVNFAAKSFEEQQSILSTYWDYLDKIKHQSDRLISFILDQALVQLKKYKNNKQFYFFNKQNIQNNINNIDNILQQFRGSLPEKDYILKKCTGGIRKLL